VMRRACIAGSLLLVASCGDEPLEEGPPEVPEGRVEVQIWNGRGARPIVLQSEAVHQDPENFKKAHFTGVYMRLPLRDGQVMLHTDRAEADDAEGDRITLAPPVHFSGAYQGLPHFGRAEEAEILLDDLRMVMDGVDWVFAGQYLRIDTLTVSEDWQRREALRPHARPAPVELIGALYSLPHPLYFPRHR